MATPRRLLLVIEHFRLAGAGAENYAVTLWRRLAERGYELHVACREGDSDPCIEVHAGTTDVAATVTAVKPDLIVDWGLSFPADLHRLGGGIHREFLRYSLRAYRGPARWLKQLDHRQPKHRRILEREARLLARPGAHFLANSDFVAEQARRCGVPPEEVTVLYNGVDANRFRPLDAAARAGQRQSWGVGPEEVVFVFAGHNLRLKNLALLTRIFSELSRQGLELRLLVMGKRRPRRTAPWLIYHGQTTSPETVYAAADALLHPTWFDACANVVLEAMSCGVPAVVSDVSGIHGLIHSGENGLVLPVAGPWAKALAGWSQAVRTLAADAALRRRLGQAARHTAERHDFQRYVERFEAVLARLYDRKAGVGQTPGTGGPDGQNG